MLALVSRWVVSCHCPDRWDVTRQVRHPPRCHREVKFPFVQNWFEVLKRLATLD